MFYLEKIEMKIIEIDYTNFNKPKNNLLFEIDDFNPHVKETLEYNGYHYRIIGIVNRFNTDGYIEKLVIIRKMFEISSDYIYGY